MSGPPGLLLDGLLALLLLGLAAAVISSREPLRGVILFIAFGLLLALVWARLGAPDVALAEAAIGAGLSGALLLAAARDERGDAAQPGADRPVTILLALLAAGFGLVLAWALAASLPAADPVRLAGAVAEQLPRSGVTNPVTAVLLNFRAYDTLLELAVLLAALLGINALGAGRPAYGPAPALLSGLAGWLVPLLLLTGAYLLWAGAHAPGGAFQAGALVAAAGVLLRLAGVRAAGLPAGLPLRLAAAGGVGLFLAVGLAVTLAGNAFLQYPAAAAGLLILLIESAAVTAIAAALVIAFLGGEPEPWSPSTDRSRPEQA
ncbi:hydrogenase subunit MbhD domain-containing protein [Thioalbus denitrificans]|uniref:Multisubunit sodium/proton antiporter MrpB subunit n=1 Tax=Thioalbus denitrificans TaxID=547122 RepID=A0A369CJ92_9GAMM|nr:hydrogenase subunit MbhD domain-containing protein [Thioalbus denitrificans]RCX32766.1 multisubunit sodium/proton antiporter MrpB subunit [Thioalbus denitrificans]